MRGFGKRGAHDHANNGEAPGQLGVEPEPQSNGSNANIFEPLGPSVLKPVLNGSSYMSENGDATEDSMTSARGRGGRGRGGRGRGGYGGGDANFSLLDGYAENNGVEGDASAKPRHSGRGRGRGGYGGGDADRSPRDGVGENNGAEGDASAKPRHSGRGRGCGRGGFGGGDADRSPRDQDGENKAVEGDAPEKPRPPPYIPAEPTEDEAEIFGAGITSGINFDKYDDTICKVSGENVPPNIESFETSNLRTYLLENVKKSGYVKPTPVQKRAIPIIMAGRDLMACAQTGSGKTAAFLLPIIHTLLDDPKDLICTAAQCQPHVIIVAPTRELAIQIFNEARKFSHGSIVRVANAYGGTAAFHQAREILKGCHILVATTGRLNDFVGRGTVSFASVRFFVMDEADRMLDMGFLGDIQKMLENPDMKDKTTRQTLMFSATFEASVQKLAQDLLTDYIFLTVGIVGGACEDVEQCFFNIPRFNKRDQLVEFLKEGGSNLGKVMVFVETKRSADFLASFLSENGFRTTSIHGDREQREREIALTDFKVGTMSVLVATAVAARGLDIKDVSYVINYDLPKDIDEYVHRIGRTGRVGNRGKAISYYNPETDGHLAKSLVRILTQANQTVPEWLNEQALCDNASGGGGGRTGGFGGRDIRKFNREPETESYSGTVEVDEGW